MAQVLPTSRIYSGTHPLSAFYEGTAKRWEPIPATPPIALTHPTITGATSMTPALNTAATSTSIILTTPTGTAVSEGLVACLTSSGTTASDITLPSGWTRIGLPAINDGAVRILGWFFTYLLASPLASYTFISPVAGRFGGFMWRVQNVSPTQPLTEWHAYGPRTGAVLTVYGMTAAIGNQPTQDSLHLVCVGGQFTAGQSAAVTTGPSGMTPLASTEFGLTSGTRTALHTWQENLSAGDTTLRSVTLAVAPTTGAAANGVVLRKAGGAVTVGGETNTVTVAGTFPNHADIGGVLNLDSWETWLGRPVTHISLNTSFSAPSAMTSSSFGNFVNTTHVSDREFNDTETSAKVCLTVGLGFGAGNMSVANKTITLNEVAAGTHDGSYRIVFDRLVAAGFADSYIRLGHEQDITWYPWSALSGNETPYKNAFAHIAAIIHAEYPGMRTVYEGNGGPFDGFSGGSSLTNAERAYPGSTAVDVIALNVYARQWVQRGRALLPWTQAFAVSKGKPFAVSEWGLWKPETTVNGGGDNVGYIQEMYDIMSSFPTTGPGALLYHTYFNELDEHRLDATVPLSRAKYLELFADIP